ncbi:hypothetical protein [Pantoea agglomerans]|uniref:hypothetical protein n=1 Tax=Enterobacter agglomerans TaxID=549 RepID=UPI00177B8AF5|nr:hypothetical protein [Pantoea agglomerans]MBD8132016.1 hypothetical protein [Pantoea agglomerans]
MQKLNELPQAFYGVIQSGKVVMLPAEDGQWLNKTSVAEAYRALEQRAEAAEAKLVELAKQKPRYQIQKKPSYGRESVWIDVASREEAETNVLHGYRWRMVYDAPAPAADLAELVPKEMPPSVTKGLVWRSEKEDGLECYHMENLKREYGTIRAAILRNIEEKLK